MPRSRTYQHFCPVARSLEVIGEKWSLLIVRDLLRGPQRFTDLMRYLGAITPKWLSQRLRDLQAAGIVERESVAGRREVWYRLTQRGHELAPVVEALAVWGIDHAMRAPRPDEPIYPEQTLYAVTTYMNANGTRLRGPAAWRFHFGERDAHTVTFDGETWHAQQGEAEADLVVTAAPQEWIAFLTAPAEDRPVMAAALQFEGARSRVREFLSCFRGAGARVPAGARS